MHAKQAINAIDDWDRGKVFLNIRFKDPRRRRFETQPFAQTCLKRFWRRMNERFCISVEYLLS